MSGPVSSHRFAHRSAWAAALSLIVLAALALRLPGIFWERGLPQAPPGFTFHPDEPKFVKQIRFFDQKSPEGQGYVKGWATHGYLLRALLQRLFKTDEVNLILLLRSLSLLYGLLTIVLVAWIGQHLFRDPALGLWAAALLALSGLHVMQSHFGTADAVSAFYFTLSAALAARFERDRSEWVFAGFALAVGAALAIKFQLGLMPLAAWVCLRDERRWLRLLQAGLFIVAGFSIVSFFNYTPWELRDFYGMLREDVRITERTGGLHLDLAFVPKSLVAGMGFGAAGLVLLGAWRLARQGISAITARRPRWLGNPWTVWVIAGFSQYLLIANMDTRAPRQVLVLIPALCLVAAQGALRLCRARRGGVGSWAVGALLALLVAYQGWYASQVARLDGQDPRFAASQWLSTHIGPGERVTAYFRYSKVPGAYPLTEELADYILTTSTEYTRYLGRMDASEVFHGNSDAARLRFWNQLFRGELGYEKVQEFTLPTPTPELWLASRQELPGIGDWPGVGAFIPESVVIFKRRAAPQLRSPADAGAPQRRDGA